MLSLRGWGICIRCVSAVRRLTTDLWSQATVLAGSGGIPCWLRIITDSTLTGQGGGRTRLWLLGPVLSGEMSHVFSCPLSIAAWEFVDCLENTPSKTARLPGSKLKGVLSMSGGHSTGVPNHPLCSWIGTSVAWCIGTSWYYLLGSTLEIIVATKMTMLRIIVPEKWLIICSKRTSLKLTSLYNPLIATPSCICRTNWGAQSTTWIIPHITFMNSDGPCWINWPISPWNACSVWWPASPGN